MLDLNDRDVVYLAGPITNRQDGNRAAFERAEAHLRNAYKCEVINPARRTPGLSYCEYMAISMLDLDKATCLVLLPDWMTSLGACCERAIARRVGIAVQSLDAEVLA
ncbi:MAG: DUF4406 domain-containing protein [Victivallaceae bacterium]|nr:DUF4406 domain-containing protein [Victivallaceae bacterium]